MKNAIIYTRVSSREQVDDGNSLETQKRICHEYAQSHGLNVIKHFQEEGESAKTTERTKLREMMAFCVEHRQEIDQLIIYRINRLSRVTEDYIGLKTYFNKLGITVASVTELITDDPSGRFVETIFAAYGQMDNEQRSIQSKTGMTDGIRAGRWQWKAPLGFVNSRVDGKRNVAHDPDSDYVDTLRMSWNLVANGFTVEESRKLINEKLKNINRKPMSFQTYSRMLRNKLYIGVVCGFGLEVQSSSIKPIADPKIFYKAHFILDGNRNSGKTYIKVNPKYPLRGVLWCVNGHKMTASSPRGRGGVYPKYHCPKCRGKGTSFNVDETEEKFMKFAESMEIKNDIRDALREAISLNLDASKKRDAKEIQDKEKRLLVIRAERKELALKSIKGVLSDATTKELTTDYDNEEILINMRLTEMSDLADDAKSLMEFGLQKLSNLADTFKALEDPNVRTRFQKWLFPAGLAYDGEKFGTATLPLIYRVKQNTLAGALSLNSRLVISSGIEPELPG